jgi:hypothetical protein
MGVDRAQQRGVDLVLGRRPRRLLGDERFDLGQSRRSDLRPAEIGCRGESARHVQDHRQDHCRSDGANPPRHGRNAVATAQPTHETPDPHAPRTGTLPLRIAP